MSMSKNKPNRHKQRVKEDEKLKDIMEQFNEDLYIEDGSIVWPPPKKVYRCKARIRKITKNDRDML
jgi:hypothetical protein